MAEQRNKSDYNAMNVAELKKIFAGTWRFSKRIFENFARGNRFRSQKNGFASGSKLQERSTDADKVTIHDMLIPNHFP